MMTVRELAGLTPGLHAVGGNAPGLLLQVTMGHGRSWLYRYQLAGRRRSLGLGSLLDLTLAEAREAAMLARKAVLAGRDPIEERRAERASKAVGAAKAVTFRECADRYITAHKAGWRSPKSLAAWEGTLSGDVFPIFGSLPVAAIDTGLVLKVLEPIWTEKPETAGRVRGRIESILDWASARGYRSGDNPSRWRGHLENLLPKRSNVRRVQHHPALPYVEIGEFMVELREERGVAARALEFAILTAARTSEVIGAHWGEINIAERLWTVPAERIKGGREHRVPLSDAAMAIIDEMIKIRSGEFVFSGGKVGSALSNMAMLKLLKRMARDDLTVHGFRSTFRDWCAERTAFPSEVCEMALAHCVSDKVEAAYRRGDLFEKRRQLAQAWADFCSMPAMSANVVSIRA
jgi:integrase